MKRAPWHCWPLAIFPEGQDATQAPLFKYLLESAQVSQLVAIVDFKFKKNQQKDKINKINLNKIPVPEQLEHC